LKGVGKRETPGKLEGVLSWTSGNLREFRSGKIAAVGWTTSEVGEKKDQRMREGKKTLRLWAPAGRGREQENKPKRKSNTP